MFGRKDDAGAERVADTVVEAFAAEGIAATHDDQAVLVAMPGGAQAPIPLAALADGAREHGEEDLREFADGVVRGFVRGCRTHGVLIGTHYPLPDDDAAGWALLGAFRDAGLAATFVDPGHVGVRLADGTDAVTDVGHYRADCRGAAPEEIAARAAEFVRVGAAPLREAGTAGGDRRDDLRLRLYPAEMLVEPMRGGVVTRELAPGLWETVAIDRPESVQPLPRSGPGEPDVALYATAVDNTVGDPFALNWFDVGGTRVLHIGGEHPYMAAHVHVLDRYLDPPSPHGALVSFPLPEVVLAHPIGGVDPIDALATVQQLTGRLVDDGRNAISRQVFWWLPVGGHARPDLRPVSVAVAGGEVNVDCDEAFEQLVQGLTAPPG